MAHLNARPIALFALCAVALLAAPVTAKVINGNTDSLPPGCDDIRDDVSLTVHGGRNHTHGFPGTAFMFDEQEWTVEPCTRVTVRFVNEDPIRHQFMVHGVWPEGFMLIEVDGASEDTGTFIAPSRASTLLIHCGLNQHQQKGMKAQMLVGGGIGDLPNIPGISGVPVGSVGHASLTGGEGENAAALGVLAVVAAVLVAGALRRR